MTVGDGFGAPPFALGRFRFLLLFELSFLLSFGLDGSLAGQGGGVFDRGDGWPDALHFRADFVDFHELFRTQQAMGHQGAIDEFSALVIYRGDEVAPTKPWISPA